MRVAVTGGSGVVGGAVVRHLIDAGNEVVALSRSADSDTMLRDLGAQPVRGDILSQDSLSGAFDGCERVFHVAGVNKTCVLDSQPMILANVNGSQNVIRAASLAGVKRVVYTSSAATLGERRGMVGNEDSEHRGSYHSEYERSKYLAEQAIWAMDTDVEVVTVNPSSVQGPGRATGTAKLILDVINGKLPALVKTDISIVDIDDCARGHLLAADNGVPGERYVLNSFTVSARDAVTLMESALGRPLKTRLLPPWLLKPVGPLLDLLTVIGIGPFSFCGEMITTVTNGHHYDGSRATRDLGLVYTPPDQVISRLITWFKSEGLIK